MFVGEAALLTVFVVAWALARLHKGSHHHYVMLSAFLVDAVVFKPLMLSRALSVYGSYPWPGTSIAFHFYLDIVVLVLGVSNIVLGFKFRTRKGGRMFMPPKGKVHRWLGYAFIAFWIFTFIAGVRIFAWAHPA